MKKAISLLLVFLLAACVLGGCAKKDEPDYAAASTSHEAYVPEDSSTTDAPDEDFDANDLFRTLSGSWEQMSSSSPGGFPSVIHAGENGNLVLEEIVFQYNGQLMFPKELAGDWMIEKDQMPAILVYPDETSSTTLGIFVQDHSEHTLTLTNGDQSCTYVRKLDPDSTVSGVGSSDPQWGSIWGMISSRMEGSWSLINQDVADNYPAAMEIYSNGAPEIDVLWQGSSYYCHWYVDGSCFCIDINDSFDQLMYHVAVDENYLVMTRRLDENTVLMDSAYYYKVAAPDYGTEIEGEDPAAMETPSEIWEHDYQPGMENTRSVYTRPYKTRIDKLSPIVRQDQMLYFVSNGILRKMPVGGDITNVQGIYPFENAFRNPKEIQVLREVTDDPEYKNAALARYDNKEPGSSGEAGSKA